MRLPAVLASNCSQQSSTDGYRRCEAGSQPQCRPKAAQPQPRPAGRKQARQLWCRGRPPPSRSRSGGSERRRGPPAAARVDPRQGCFRRAVARAQALYAAAKRLTCHSVYSNSSAFTGGGCGRGVSAQERHAASPSSPSCLLARGEATAAIAARPPQTPRPRAPRASRRAPGARPFVRIIFGRPMDDVTGHPSTSSSRSQCCCRPQVCVRPQLRCPAAPALV
jgi:hypothetical protein